ncbi:hypothetical protein Tco_1182976 [Tanacetum coccineum]
MEYLVKISKKARILELKQRHLKITVLTSYTPYPSRKIRHICACTSQETTKIQSPIRRIQENSIRRIQYRVITSAGFVLKKDKKIKHGYQIEISDSDSVSDSQYAVFNRTEYAVLIFLNEYALLDRKLDTPYPMEVDTPYRGLEYGRYGISKVLDTAYWGFLGVRTTHIYAVSSLKDMAYWLSEQFGINKWYQSFALRNFDLEDIEFESTNSGTTAKLPILKLGEYECTTNNTGNGTSVTKMSILVTAEEKTNKKNDVKARGLHVIVWSLPNEHQLTFSQYPDAKSMFSGIETRFGGNAATKKTLLKQQYENFSASSAEFLDSIFNRLQKIVSRLAILG